MDVTKDHHHRKNSSLQHLLAKLCSQFSGMLNAWCIQNSYLLAQDFTTKWHCEKLGKLKAWLQPLFPHMEQPVLQYDNWTSARSVEIQRLGFTTLDCSWCSPDFGVSDFHLLAKVNEQLTRHHYMSPCGSVIICTNLLQWTHKTTWTLVKACRLKR